MAGAGHGSLALFVTLLTVLDLELRHVPVINRLDAHRYADHMETEDADNQPPQPGTVLYVAAASSCGWRRPLLPHAVVAVTF